MTAFGAGVLAGSFFVIDYGVAPAVANVVDEQAHIRLRQALIRSLRVLVPAMFIPTILLGLVVTVLDAFTPGFGFRLAGLLGVLACFGLTLLGTTPINATVLTWQPNAPPQLASGC